jgi:hypothetical protein
MRTLFLFLALSASAHAADIFLEIKIIKCESSFREEVWGDDRKSYGIAQFRKPTFYEFAAASIKEGSWNHKVLGVPNIKNPQQQMFLLDWGLNHGYGRRWTCYRKIRGE